MKTLKLPLTVLSFALLAGCSNPADKVPAATVNSDTNAPVGTAADADSSVEAQSFTLTPTSSKVEFVGSKVTGSHDGGFTNFIGELRIANGKVLNTGNKVVIDTQSLWSDNDRLTGHLKSPDFFDVAKFPTAVFETTTVVQQGTNATVTGNLTLHGITKQISFPAQILASDKKVSVNADFAINRFDFNMQYPGKADDLIRKEVVLKLKVNAEQGEADFASLEKAAAAITTTVVE